MILSLIAAMGHNRVIGQDKKIPWHLPADFAYFKETTIGHPIIMGRTTFESIGKPLPGRKNIVLTRGTFDAPGVVIAHTLDEAIQLVKDEEEVFIIGGACVYGEALPRADRLYVTFVDGKFDGNVFFPHVDWKDWKEVKSSERKADEKNSYDARFSVFVREKKVS